MPSEPPAWRKRKRWPLVLGLFAVYVFFAWGALIVGVTLYLGKLSEETVGQPGFDRIYFGSIATFVVCAAALTVAVATMRLDHRRASARISEIIVGLSAGALPAHEPLVLYLRSFDTSHSYGWRRFTSNDDLDDPEISLGRAIADRATLVAIGDGYDQYHALKVATSDARWKQVFRDLADRACLIFCFIGGTPASVFEIETILGDETLCRKTAFLSPPRAYPEHYARMRELFAARGREIPDYAKDGQFFRVHGEGHSPRSADYAEVLRILARLDFSAPGAADAIWPPGEGPQR
jgi:hypothetical protein